MTRRETQDAQPAVVGVLCTRHGIERPAIALSPVAGTSGPSRLSCSVRLSGDGRVAPQLPNRYFLNRKGLRLQR